MKTRHANVEWIGDLQEGGGQVDTESQALAEKPFGFGTRFLDEPGTNPEELLAAAHASCFTTHLAHLLAKNGTPPESMQVSAAVKLDWVGDERVELASSHISVATKVAHLDGDRYREIVREASKDCPMSRALQIRVSVEASLM